MAFIALPNGIKVEMEFILNGEVVVNVYYVTRQTPIVSVNLSQVAEIFRDWWLNTLRSAFSNQISLVAVIATDWSIEDGEQHTLVVSPASPGAIAQPAAPNNVASVVSLLTGFTGRSNRGRKYMAGMTVNDVSDNFMGAGYINTVTAAFVTLDSTLTGQGFEHVVASFFSNGAPRPVGQARLINAYRVDGRIDTQRRRLPGQGI